MSECKCQEFSGPGTFWCETHQCRKTAHWQKLCQTRADYRALWDEGRGPGQTHPNGTEPRQPPKSAVRGVGWHLAQIIESLGMTPRGGCGCKALAREMDRLGPDKCRRNRSLFVEKLETNAKRYNWGDVATAVANAAKNAAVAAVHLERVWLPNPLDPYGSLLDEAIRRAEAENRS